MSHSFFDHAADVGVDIQAPSRDALFAEALRAFTDTLVPLDRLETSGSAEREISLTADSLEDLMVAWLEELLFLFEVDSLLFSGAGVRVEEGSQSSSEAGAFRLHATARGELYDPERHPLKVLIKGVTYHELTVEETADGWRARVIFDI